MNVLNILFCDLARKLENIKDYDNESRKIELLKELLQPVIQTQNVESIFSLLRLLLPHIDKDRTTYYLKEVTIGKIFSNALNIRKGSEYYKQLHINEYPEVQRPKDYSRVVFNISRTFNDKPPSQLSVTEVNEHLTNISEGHASEFLKAFIKHMSPLELKWIVRIILKDVRLGVTTETVLNIVDPQAAVLYQQNNNLHLIIEKTISKAPNAATVLQTNVFEFIKPMLSVKASKKLFSQINITGYYVEEKFDGERFQFHYDNSEGIWYSRNGNRYTSFNHLTEKIRLMISQTGDEIMNFIVDGEMIGYNVKTWKYGTKGFNYDIKKHTETSVYQPCFIVFDVISFNNENIMHLPLKRRLQILEKIFPNDKEFFLKKSHVTVLKTPTDLLEHFNKAIKNDLEGIIIKEPYSSYVANKRLNSWIKIKPEYFDGLIVDLDLLIVGGFYGDGRQSGKIATFLLAVYDSKRNQYICASESGLGLTNFQLDKLQQRLIKHWVKMNKDCPPKSIKFGKLKPHVWIEPEKSIILEMKASELHPADKYATTHTLRFPRIIRVRYDKPYDQCMMLDEFNDLIHHSVGPVVKLSKRAAGISDLFDGFNNRVVERQTIECVSEILKGKTFCVLSGNKMISTENVEEKIIENGGLLGSKEHASTILLAGDITFEVSTEIKLKRYNIINVTWLLTLLETGIYKEWTPLDAIITTEDKNHELNLLYDQYSDHFTEHATISTLKRCLNAIPQTSLLNV